MLWISFIAKGGHDIQSRSWGDMIYFTVDWLSCGEWEGESEGGTCIVYM